MVFSIRIDSSTTNICQKLLYYIQSRNTENLLYNSDGASFILECCIKERDKKNIFLLIPKEPITFLFEGVPITCRYEKGRESLNCNFSEVRFDQFILESDDFEHLTKFLDVVNDVELHKSEEKLTKYNWNKSYWKFNKYFKKRKLDTIYLPKNDKTTIVSSLDTFLNDAEIKKKYEDLGIPNKKIYLFYGVPGSGKTTTIRVLASEFNYNIAYVQNSSEITDTVLEEMIAELPSKTFLVFEDIDCLFNKRDSNDFKNNLSFSGLLNSLDGISSESQENLVIFITTNYIQNLDAALKRRIDIFTEFTYIKREEVRTMYARFFPDSADFAELYALIKSIKTTANNMEKFFIYCIQAGVLPINNVDYLSEYGNKTIDTAPSGLYI